MYRKDLMTKCELRKNSTYNNILGENTGLLTLQDILKELEKLSSCDPHGNAPAFEFDANVKRLKIYTKEWFAELSLLTSTAFGCFVDVGSKTRWSSPYLAN